MFTLFCASFLCPFSPFSFVSFEFQFDIQNQLNLNFVMNITRRVEPIFFKKHLSRITILVYCAPCPATMTLFCLEFVAYILYSLSTRSLSILYNTVRLKYFSMLLFIL